MDVPAILLELAGSVALLLWGVHMVQTGRPTNVWSKAPVGSGDGAPEPPQAFAAGAGITALLQSSTATGLMVTGFVASSIVDLVPALAVMLGANVGTTLIVQVLSFEVSGFAPAFNRSSMALRQGQSLDHYCASYQRRFCTPLQAESGSGREA